VIAPQLNEPDIDEIPEHLRSQIDFVFVDHVDQVLAEALEGGAEVLPARRDRQRRAATGSGRRAARAR
jgi:ATP-dependent Lon protease